MVPDLITDAQVRAQLRLDPPTSNADPDSAWIAIWIPVVSQMVAGWLKDEYRLYLPETDSNGDILTDSNGDWIPTSTVNPLVQGAALAEIAVQYEHRTGEGNTTVPSADGWGYTLCKAATSILSSVRKSTVR